MWTARITPLARENGLHIALDHGAGRLTVADVVHNWRTDAAFNTYFNDLLADLPFAAFRWETPPITSQTLADPFECVALDSPGLALPADPVPFAGQFDDAAPVVTFANLGGDAVLVVPCPVTAHEAYGHLAAFTRRAPAAQRQALWRQVGEAVHRRISDRPLWLSTAGGGVAWLHVRLDDRPKYYRFDPYRHP